MAAASVSDVLKAASSASGKAVAILGELLAHQVCPRCTLRFCGVRSGLYQKSMPAVTELKAALEKAHPRDGNKSTCNVSQGVSENQTAAPEDSTQQSACAAEHPCAVCLGVLQNENTLKRPTLHPKQLQSIDVDSTCGTWSSVEYMTADAIGMAIKKAGYKSDTFFIEVSLPASTFLRQLAFSYHLETKLGKDVWDAERCNSEIIDLKEAVRASLFDSIQRVAGKKLDVGADVRLKFLVQHPETSHESGFLCKNQQQQYHGKRWRGGQKPQEAEQLLTDRLVQSALGLSKLEFSSKYRWPPKALHEACQCAIKIWRNPIHVGGYYLKKSRSISQAPWFINDERKGSSSVQEEIAKVVLPLFDTSSYKFITAGREDIDVRMMGEGRPFVFEIQDAKNPVPPLEDLMEAERKMQEAKVKVEVRKLSFIKPAQLSKLKEGEEEKEKTYAALCCTSRPVTQDELDKKLNAVGSLSVVQRTPVRVLHRRALMNRPKSIHEMHAAVSDTDSCLFTLELKTSAGLYVKEFVHGDFGRTQPNVADMLGCDADLLTLDVTRIHLDFI